LKEQRQDLTVLGEISKRLAHEIRNPLTGISTMAQLLDTKISESDPRKKYVRQMMKEVENVNRLIKDILNLTRPIDLCPSSTNVYELFEEVLDQLREQIAGSNVTVANELVRDFPTVECDRQLMSEVFRNIVSGSLERMDSGCVTTGGEVLQKKDEERARLWVRDDGVGHEGLEPEQLFSPFNAAKTRRGSFGFATARKIVEAHGGRAYAVTNKGSGLTVVAELPLNLQEVAG